MKCEIYRRSLNRISIAEIIRLFQISCTDVRCPSVFSIAHADSVVGLESWIANKESGIFQNLDTSDIETCQKCNEQCEDLFSIKCGHYFCTPCIEGIQEYDDDDLGPEVSDLEVSDQEDIADKFTCS